ncbi:hypothetical protein VR41_10410 [Streptomyces sp. NRRL B-1568]|nr:hypothetical protein VR41_10410 [Streptomyces sp. NRRL B-1568]
MAGAALLAAATTVTALVTGAGTSVAAPARAAAAYNQECGTGYAQVNQIPIPGRRTSLFRFRAPGSVADDQLARGSPGRTLDDARSSAIGPRGLASHGSLVSGPLFDLARAAVRDR